MSKLRCAGVAKRDRSKTVEPKLNEYRTAKYHITINSSDNHGSGSIVVDESLATEAV